MYRERFINTPMLGGVEIRGRRVLEAMCGSGSTTSYLLRNGADVTGIDISRKQLDLFAQRWPEASAVPASILSPGFAAESFDCVVIVGGLHHVQPHVQQAIDEVHRILSPGGYFCFAEPHRASLADLVRRCWYRLDPLFARGERSVDLDVLEVDNASRFEIVARHYLGNIAYLLVLNSLVFRTPAWLKRLYSPPLLGLEAAIGRIQGPRTSCFVVSRWRKR